MNFENVTSDAWLNFWGTLIGTLFGTLIAGVISYMLAKKAFKDSRVLDSEIFRRKIVQEEEKISKLILFSKTIFNGLSKGNDNDIKLLKKDVENKTEFLLQKFQLDEVPSFLYNDMKEFLSKTRQLVLYIDIFQHIDIKENEGDIIHRPEQLINEIEKHYENIKMLLKIK